MAWNGSDIEFWAIIFKENSFRYIEYIGLNRLRCILVKKLGTGSLVIIKKLNLRLIIHTT